MTMEDVVSPKSSGRPMDIQEEVCDAEVMHVVNLKKQKVVTVSNEELDRERPMSWEGELSDDDDNNSTAGQPLKIGKNPDINGTVCPRPLPPIPGNPGSPMCLGDGDENYHQIPKSLHQQSTANGTLTQCVMNGTCSPSTHLHPAISTTCSTSNRNAPVTYAAGQGTVYTNDRLSLGHPPPYENSVCGHHSPAQSRHMVGYTGPYSQSPSPVLTRPTSSSSSRSSYSPAQSPLLGRYVSALYSHNPSPVLSRHTTGNSSDGSVYSPLSSPSQGRHGATENSVICSPSQSPSQGRRSDNDGPSSYSPDRSPAHIYTNSRRVVYSAPSPPNHVHWTVPDQSSVTLNNENNIAVHTSHSENTSFETRVIHISPLLQRSTQDARSTASSASVASSASDESNASDFASPTQRLSADNSSEEGKNNIVHDPSQSPLGMSAGQGISRQQLLSGPCPICGDRISGFHYGIFSCESCKGFFKRTVQNKKNYVCLRGANCHIAINTRKKCPACRFDKCLKTGMKLEAIREDRTRGGRSTYQCSYTLPNQPLGDSRMSSSDCSPSPVSSESARTSSGQSLTRLSTDSSRHSPEDLKQPTIPALIQSILAVEHLWYSTDREGNRLSEQLTDKMTDGDPDFLGNLCNIADNRLFKIVKWCKSLPLFREIQTDDQIALLINSWCELLLLSCCYRSMATPNEIRVSHGKYLNLTEARMIGLGPVIERMLNMTDHMRHLKVDQYEYVCLKVIILLTSDASGLKEPDKVRDCQKQVLEALQTYTRTHYPLLPSKFGELLLRIPDLERACQVGKESLASKQRIGEVPSFNLLMELLRGDH